MQGHDLRLMHRGLQTVLHVGIDDPDGVDLARVKAIQQQLGNMPRPVQRGVLRRVEKALFHGHAPLGEPAAAVFTHHIQRRARMLRHELLPLADDILVIGAGQSLVRRDQQTRRHAGQGLCVGVCRDQIAALDGAVGVEHAADLRLQRLKVGAGVIQLLLGLAQLGLRDQIHGVGDLLGLPHASDAPADLTGARHALTARLCA